MPASFLDTDLNAIFNPKDFGESEDNPVRWIHVPDVGDPEDPVTITGAIFDDEDIVVETGESLGQIISQPTVTALKLLVPTIRQDDIITARGETFKVKNTQSDGVGVIEIYLTRVR